MKNTIRPTIVMFVLLTLICCGLYPLAITAIGQTLFRHEANGSLRFDNNGKLIGSDLIGQEFSSPKYFWGRISATSPMPYNPNASGGSNLAPTNPALVDQAKGRITALKAADASNTAPIPVDLATASGSGLDPEISVAAAYYQAGRVARERKLSVDAVRGLIDSHSTPRYFGFFGEARVNVLALNLDLDGHK